MLKTVLHIVVALALWFGLGAIEVAIPWRIGAIVCGAVAVHFFWERLVFNPFLYLGAMPVSHDDPVMVKAREQAARTLPHFLDLIYPKHKDDSMVKFRFSTSTGEIENLWADLIGVEGENLRVFLRTPPINHEGDLERTQSIDVEDVVDWQVEYQDGTLRGGYTNRALFTIFEREEGYVHPKFQSQIARFKEIDEPVEA